MKLEKYFIKSFLHHPVSKNAVEIITRPIALSRVLREQRPTDGPTDRRTDRVAYRVACTRLKRSVKHFFKDG